VGTAPFAATEAGMSATAVEIMPLGVEVMEVRREIALCDRRPLVALLNWWAEYQPWNTPGETLLFPHLNLTRGQFPDEVERKIGKFCFDVSRMPDRITARLFRLALLDALEPVSFALRDGQYLRKNAHLMTRGGKLRKTVAPFSDALAQRLRRMADDLTGLSEADALAWWRVNVVMDSSLDLLLTGPYDLPGAPFSAVVTSPPYLNRYDYTRNYALELALLGLSEIDVLALRQRLLTCTVENREKHLRGSVAEEARQLLSRQPLFRAINTDLERQRFEGSLNNNSIPHLVRNYVLELVTCLVGLRDQLVDGAPVVMVNDNVQYAGVHVPLDLILSDVAERAGFRTEVLWYAPRGKGNSSQQMEKYGRRELRKGIWVWRKKS
jgi:hypothetical protein